MKKLPLALFVQIFPPLFLVGLVVFRFAHFETYLSYIKEDSVFESLQALLYFVTGLSWGYLSYESFKSKNTLAALFAAGIAVLLTLVSIEEISWGQRVIGLVNPEYFEKHNVQKEVSIHNLDTIQPFIHYGYMVIGIVLAWIWKKRFLWYFLPVVGVYAVLEFIKPFGIVVGSQEIPLMVWRDQEPVEFLLALGLSLSAVDLLLGGYVSKRNK